LMTGSPLAVKRRGRSSARRDLVLALEGAISAADPAALVRRNVTLSKEVLRIHSLKFILSRYRRVLVVGGGKASGKMAVELERIIGDFITGGAINVPEHQRFESKGSKIIFSPATHPIPSRKGSLGVERMLSLVGRPSKDDMVICLISGGASALLPLPSPGVTIAEKAEATKLLLKSGADINEMNVVRKHLSLIKGGRLAKILFPATVVSLIISDVVGNRLDSIGSGLTAPDPTTYAEARSILVRRDLWTKVSPSIRRTIGDGITGRLDETPKPGATVFRRVHNVVLASNRLSRLSAAEKLRRFGYQVSVLREEIKGEARVVGGDLASRLVKMKTVADSTGRVQALVAGGETVVTLHGNGRGGRNQELVLSAALRLKGEVNISMGAVATDGIDGPTDAAGAIADGTTVERAKEMGLDPRIFLERNDSYHLFKRLGNLVVTGPTGTNVNDVVVGVVRPTSVGAKK
jgi:glycerate 2-kinase